MLVAFNLSPSTAVLALPAGPAPAALSGHGLPEGHIDGERLVLPAHAAFFGSISQAS
jgi:hypothetical protein